MRIRALVRCKAGLAGLSVATLAVVWTPVPRAAETGTAPGRAVQIGVVIDGPGPLNEPVSALVRDAIDELSGDTFDITYPISATRVADWSAGGVSAALDAVLADPDVDLVLAMGVIASYDAARRGPLPKPVIAPFVLNSGGDIVPDPDGASGIRNLSYLLMPRTFRRDVEAFSEIVALHELAVLYSGRIARALPDIPANAAETLEEMGIRFESVLVEDDTRAALSRLDSLGTIDGVFVMPQIHLPVAEMRELADGLVARRLPSFSLLGRRDVEAGILGSLNPDIFPRLARRVALHVHNTLLGDPPSEMSVAFAAGERLTVNTGTADAIGLPLSWSMVTQADIVSPEADERARRVNLDLIVEEALRVNADLDAAALAVDAGAADVSRARSALLPRIDLRGTGVVIDEDRASPLSAAERTITGAASASQVIWSEPALADLAIQRSRQEQRVAEYDAVRLDVAQAAATAYFRVLRASSLEQIQKRNVQLTRSNLELAEVRELIGQSGPSETLRFQSQLASDTRDAIEANSRRNVAEMELNRILSRPLEEPFAPEDESLEGLIRALRESGLTRFFDSKASFAAFREFMAREAVDASPELAALDAAITAQDRALSSASRAFWSPTLTLAGEVAHRFDESGAGTGDPPAVLGSAPDDTDWNVALSLTFPLFSGGGKLADRSRAHGTLAELRRRREATAERIEQRVRAALHLAGASHAGIYQADIASDAARRSLDAVVDAYGQGVVSILDLLDAQTTARVAEEQAAAAIYDFLIDLMEAQRAVGRLSLFIDPAERRSLIERCTAYFDSRGLADPGRR